MGYLLAKEVDKNCDITRRRVQVLFEQSGVQATFKLSDVWVKYLKV